MNIKLYLAGLIMLLCMSLSQGKNIERLDSAKRAMPSSLVHGRGAKTSLEKEPIVQEGRQWSTRVIWPVAPPQLYTEIYRMEGDTVLDKKTYKKIYCYYTEDLANGKLYHHAMRQDGDKVYLKIYGEKGETLFFDFSIKKGKVFPSNRREFIVEAIGDTVLSPDNKVRQAVFLKDKEHETWKDVWVEGIGSLDYGINWDGLLYLAGSKSYALICCHQNEEQIYQNPYYNSCFIGKAPEGLSNDHVKPNPAAFWRLSPQPATEIVRAVCEASADGTWREGRWRLVDASGKALLGGVFTDGCFEISLSDRPAGLYFIEITAADGSTCRLKCLKATR